jgi:hypothetical protein
VSRRRSNTRLPRRHPYARLPRQRSNSRPQRRHRSRQPAAPHPHASLPCRRPTIARSRCSCTSVSSSSSFIPTGQHVSSLRIHSAMASVERLQQRGGLASGGGVTGWLRAAAAAQQTGFKRPRWWAGIGQPQCHSSGATSCQRPEPDDEETSSMAASPLRQGLGWDARLVASPTTRTQWHEGREWVASQVAAATASS